MPVGSCGSVVIEGRSYVSKELWNSIRYSFMKPDSIKKNWNKYIEKEPFGYVFEFQINTSELLPDEDAIGAGVSCFLNNKGNNFYKKYLKNIDKKLLTDVKGGHFKSFAILGKIIEPNLTKQDIKSIIIKSSTATVNKTIYHKNIFKIKKPNKKFLKTKKEFMEHFKKNQKI